MLRNRGGGFREVATAWSRGRDHRVTPNSFWGIDKQSNSSSRWVELVPGEIPISQGPFTTLG